jgi:hypothetical protein
MIDMLETTTVLAQIDSVLADVDALKARAEFDDLSGGVGDDEVLTVETRCIAALERLAPEGSRYRTGVKDAISTWGTHHGKITLEVAGMLRALRGDYEAGYLSSLVELVHSDTFGDFLEMADHLREGGYKDAAAVIAGSTLEAHLRQLAAKHGIAATDAKGGPLKADRLNADLVKAGAYEKGDQKAVTSWLDTRNNAAHGDYEKYAAEQVGLMTEGIRNFMQRIPA